MKKLERYYIMSSIETTLKQKVYNGIMDLIVTGEILPGSIITEKSIIEKFNYSKSPVREAMLELCKDGILSSIPRCGYQVTQLTNKTFLEIVEVRLMVEIANFRNISDKISNEIIDETFKDVEEKLKIKEKPVWEAENNNTNFHMRLIQLSGNQLLIEFLQKILDMYSRAYGQMYLAVPNIISPIDNHNHNLFLEAWKNREYQKAEEYLIKDILLSLEEVQYVKY